jgi:probable addiction module antidote protein
MTVEVGPWDAAEHLRTKEEIAYYLEAALEDGDAAHLRKALGNIARTEVAKKACLPALPDDALKALGIVIKTLELGMTAARKADQAAE